MKSTKTSDLRNLSDQELRHQLEENQRNLVDLRFRSAVGQLDNPSVIRTVRRDTARLMTILRERENAQQQG